jgi:hypothetical protein
VPGGRDRTHGEVQSRSFRKRSKETVSRPGGPCAYRRTAQDRVWRRIPRSS